MRNHYLRLIGASLLFALAACGSDSNTPVSTFSTSSATVYGKNVAPIVVNKGLFGKSENILFTTVTICEPGTARCQTIDNIQVDTGSVGLRIVSSALAPLNLPLQQTAPGELIGSCVSFGVGTLWGSVRLADIKIGGKTASSLPIQMVGDPIVGPVPKSCDTSTGLQNTASTLGANGILGIGVFLQDCGSRCDQEVPLPGNYYTCSTGSCVVTRLATPYQIQHPVARFSSDNNGTVIVLPSIGNQGAASVTGSLVFGIGTQANNALDNATVLPVDPESGMFTSTIAGTSYPNSIIDSGSSALYLPAGLLPVCSDDLFLCPQHMSYLVATNSTGSAQRQTSAPPDQVTFAIGNANALRFYNPSSSAFNNLGAVNYYIDSSVDWGLPFFFGKRVYTAISSAQTPVGQGPYLAYTKN